MVAGSRVWFVSLVIEYQYQAMWLAMLLKRKRTVAYTQLRTKKPGIVPDSYSVKVWV